MSASFRWVEFATTADQDSPVELILGNIAMPDVVQADPLCRIESSTQEAFSLSSGTCEDSTGKLDIAGLRSSV